MLLCCVLLKVMIAESIILPGQSYGNFLEKGVRWKVICGDIFELMTLYKSHSKIRLKTDFTKYFYYLLLFRVLHRYII